MKIRVDTVAENTTSMRNARRRVLPSPLMLSHLPSYISTGGIIFILTALVVLIYHGWLVPGIITAGDFPYFTPAHLKEGLSLPALWQPAIGTGAYDILDAPMFPVAFVEGLFAHVGIGWAVSERLFWIIPAVAIPCAATYALSLSLFQKRLAALVAALSIVTNSYIYILYEGGQFGVAIGYGCMPLVLWAFARGQRRSTLNSYVLTGLCMALQAMYDIRSTYISLGVCLVYVLFYHRHDRDASKGARWLLRWLRSFGLPHLAIALVILSLVHAWWFVPALLVRAPSLPAGYAKVSGLHALSLVSLSDALALFHPFWFANDVRIAPVNPLFFIMPLLIFALLWRRYWDKPVLFLSAVALVAVFLVKGDNEPFGAVYDWLFVHLPGFFLFRDASKFFQPLTLAYALLFGRAVAEVSGSFRGVTVTRLFQAAVLIPFMALAMLPASPALLHQVRGTFASNPVPTDYAQFNNFVDRQHDFFRVLWVPARPRFGTSTILHPSLDADQGSPIGGAFLSTRSWAWLGGSSSAQALRALSVRYIVVPDAMEGDVIGTPGSPTGLKVSPQVALSSVRAFFPRRREFVIGHLHIFVDDTVFPLLFVSPLHTRATCTDNAACTSSISSVAASGISAVREYTSGTSWYDVTVHASHQPFDIVLSQTYDANWLVYLSPKGISPWLTFLATPLPASDHHSFNGYANGWSVRKTGSYHIILVYWPERLVLLGLILSLIVLLAYSVLILYRQVLRRDLIHP